MAERTIYACAPKKNRRCPKTRCKFNPNAKDKLCGCTTQRRFAKRGPFGSPIIEHEPVYVPDIPLRNKIANKIRYGPQRIRRKILNLHNRFRC